MNFPKEASKLLTNKYFLYFIVFLAVTNVFGYLVTNKTNAVIFFALVSVLTFQFSKNMAVVLLVALIATNFMMSSKMMREGLENATSDTTDSTTEDSTSLQKAMDTDTQIAGAVPAVKNAKTTKDAKTAIDATMDSTMDSTMDQPSDTTTPGEPEGFGEKMGNNKKSSGKGIRLDHAATMSQAYENLQSMLGPEGIKGLKNDTKQLMAQQQELFSVMEGMVPALENAQGLLQKFDINGIISKLGKGVPKSS